MVYLDVCKGLNHIGRLGEHEHRTLRFWDSANILAMYPEATVTVLHKRPGDAQAYPVAPGYVEIQDGIVLWTIQSGDLARVGKGQVELVFHNGNTIAKSIIFDTFIDRALDGAGDPPEPWESWIDEVTDAADRAEDAAELLENPGATAETLSAGSEATASYSDGTFHFGIPRGQQGGKGDPGDDYVITEEDYDEIAEAVIESQGLQRIVDDATDYANIAHKLVDGKDLDGNPDAQYSENNAEFFKDQAQAIADSLGGDIGTAVDNWLDDHPEATTTVQDGTITEQKLAQSLKDKIVYVTELLELSEEDGAANALLLNQKLSNENVTLKQGNYPLDGTILIDGKTLDLNGSKVTFPVYTAGSSMFQLSGYKPCIMNGEIEGCYVSGGTYSSNQTCITVYNSSDVLIKNLHIHHIPGRGIDDNLNSKYGERINFSSAESYSDGTHTTAKETILTGYKYIRTIGGVGYNSAYTVALVVYRFYDRNNNNIKTVNEIPSCPVEIPSGAVMFDLRVQTGKNGLSDGFVPFGVGFTNYNSFELIDSCIIHDCKDWGIANLFGEAHVFGTSIVQPFNKGFDIEDHQASKLICENCDISGRMYVNAFYAVLNNCKVDTYVPYYGKLHKLDNCVAEISIESNADIFYKKPLVCINGGEVYSRIQGNYSKELTEKVKTNQMLLCSGIICDNILNSNMFGDSHFTFRSQSIKTYTASYYGITVGRHIIRTAGSLLPSLNAITSPGSHLSIYADVESISGQISTSLASNTGDCYGLHGENCIIYPAGHTIYDSSFAPYGGNTGSSNLNDSTGKYVRCSFDAKNSNIIAAKYLGGFDFTFNNCSFKNLTENRLLLENASRIATATLTFNNCTFEDSPITSKNDVLTYICSNLTRVVIVIDGTSYTAD